MKSLSRLHKRNLTPNFVFLYKDSGNISHIILAKIRYHSACSKKYINFIKKQQERDNEAHEKSCISAFHRRLETDSFADVYSDISELL